MRLFNRSTASRTTLNGLASNPARRHYCFHSEGTHPHFFTPTPPQKYHLPVHAEHQNVNFHLTNSQAIFDEVASKIAKNEEIAISLTNAITQLEREKINLLVTHHHEYRALFNAFSKQWLEVGKELGRKSNTHFDKFEELQNDLQTLLLQTAEEEGLNKQKLDRLLSDMRSFFMGDCKDVLGKTTQQAFLTYLDAVIKNLKHYMPKTPAPKPMQYNLQNPDNLRSSGTESAPPAPETKLIQNEDVLGQEWRGRLATA